jgi:hypothetical protein
VFESLDFVYSPVDDVVAVSQRYVDELGAALRWRVRGMGTMVACLELAEGGPPVLLSGHLGGVEAILVFRVADYGAAVELLRAGGGTEIHEIEIPHGPLAAFRAPGGQRMAVYELTRPFAVAMFDGRVDD